MTCAVALVMPVLSGSEVTLRAFSQDDDEAVLDAATDPLIPLITTVPSPAGRASVAAYIERQHERSRSGEGYSFAIDAGAGCVGQIGLWLRDFDHGRATIGYWVRPAVRGHGYAAAALALLSDWAFAVVGVARLQLVVDPENPASWRTAESVGFQREGLLREWELVGDARRDMWMYGLTLTDRLV